MSRRTIHFPALEHLSWEECITRWPRLTAAVQQIIIGTPGEAGVIIRDYREGFTMSCEACSHSGLTPLQRIRAAISYHHWETKHYKELENAA